MPSSNEMKRFRQRVVSNKTLFTCPLCETQLYPKAYEEHCTIDHGLNSKLNCVWCLGEKSWYRGEKDLQVDHLFRCWLNFISTATQVIAVTRSPAVPFDSTPVCPKRDFFERADELSARGREVNWPLSLFPPRLSFTDDNLNLAASCVQTYLETRDSAEWLHVMIRSVAFESFLKALDADGGKTRTLPFSCWCDGGEEPEARYRQHRHMIVVSPPAGHFEEKVWKKVSTNDQPYSNFPCKRFKRIESPMHLVNTMGYLSQRESQCIFTFDESLTKSRKNHFYIYSELPKDFRMALVTLWDNGLLQLLDQKYGNLDPIKFVQRPLDLIDTRWKIRVKDIPGIRLNVTLPISEHFFPVNYPTPFYLHLVDGKKLYFKRRKNETQKFCSVFGIVENEWWTPPSRFQQKCLNTIRPYYDQNNILKRKLESAEQEILELKAECKRLKRTDENVEFEVSGDPEPSQANWKKKLILTWFRTT